MKKRNDDLTSSNSGTDSSSDIVNQQPTGGDGGHILGEHASQPGPKRLTHIDNLRSCLDADCSAAWIGKLMQPAPNPRTT